MAEDVDASSRGLVIVMPAIADQADESEHPEHTSQPAFQNGDSSLLYPLVRDYGTPITTRYPYRKLPNGQIRLLKLFPKSFVENLIRSAPDTGTGPGITVETLHGDLIDVNIADSGNIAYTCLSYAWGTEAQTTPIWIQDYRMGITPTLNRALRCLMRQDEPRLVWVDFICINQDDLVERKEQVELMYQIYHGAEDVCVYLGDEEDGSEEVAALLMDILRAVNWESESESGTPGPCVQKDLLPPRESHVWKSLRKVLERPWFTRVWVVQEVIAAKELNVICGRWKMPGRAFFLAVEAGVDQELPFTPTTDEGNSWAAPISSSIRQILLMGQLGIFVERDERVEEVMVGMRLDWSLLDLLERSRHAKSTDPRDRVFAFLNLCREREEKGLGPDYTETAADTYLRVAKFFVEKGGEGVSRLLCNALLSESTLNLPSWVPDWSLSNLPFENIAPEPYWGEVQMPSAGGTEGDFNLEGSYNGLRVSAVVVGHIMLLDRIHQLAEDTLSAVSQAQKTESRTSGPDGDQPEKHQPVPPASVLSIETPAGLLPWVLAALSSFDPSWQKWPVLFRYLNNVRALFDSFPSRYEGHDPAEVVWRTMVCDREAATCRRAPASYGESAKAYIEVILTAGHGEFTRAKAESILRELGQKAAASGRASTAEDRSNAVRDFVTSRWAKGKAFSRAASRLCYRLRAAATNNGFVGLVPHRTEIGTDFVVVIKGVCVPMILRKVEGYEDRYSVVGQAYFYGLMEGEVFGMPEFKLQSIVLV